MSPAVLLIAISLDIRLGNYTLDWALSERTFDRIECDIGTTPFAASWSAPVPGKNRNWRKT